MQRHTNLYAASCIAAAARRCPPVASATRERSGGGDDETPPNNDARSTTIGRAIACVYGLARACGNEPHLAVAHARGELVDARGEPLDV